MNLHDMAAEVEQVNREHGWYDVERTFGELIALLHSEVSEALEAYRKWGLVDVTPHVASDAEVKDLLGIEPLECAIGKPYVPKPEGVGSELADVLIRLLDMCNRLGIDLGAEVGRHHGRWVINERFGNAACTLHMMISRLAFAHDAQIDGPDPEYTIEPHYAHVLVGYLAQWAEFLGIDLEAEYRRKIEYNKTRPYRHGGKKL